MLKRMARFLRINRFIIHDRIKSLPLFVLMFLFSACLDLLGIGLVFPFIAVIENPQVLAKNPFGRHLSGFFGLDSSRSIILCLGLGIVVVFCVKGWISFHVQKRITKFGFDFLSELRSRLMRIYQQLPYINLVNKNTSALVQSIQYNASGYVSGTLIASLKLISDFIILCAILVFLIYLDWRASVIMTAFLCTNLFIYNFFVKKRLKQMGEEATVSTELITKGISHALGAFKEIRVLGVEDYFHRYVSDNAQRFSIASTESQALTLIPRYLIEFMVVSFFVVFVLFLTFFGGQEEGRLVMPMLVAFGISAVRLMPSIQQITFNINSLYIGQFRMNSLYADLKELDSIPLSNKMNFLRSQSDGQDLAVFETLSLEHVCFQYPQTRFWAVDDVSFTISKGQSVGLVGSSGCGKTTLADLILGFLTPDSGQVRVNGLPIDGVLRSWLDLAAYIPQDVFLIDDTLLHNIAFGKDAADIDMIRVNQAVAMSRLSEVVEQLPLGLETMIGERGVRLSGGQCQRVALARALYYQRDFIVLDEATSALDSATEKEVVGAINALKGTKTLLVIAHRVTTLASCDVIYRLDKGRVVDFGSYEKVIGK